MAASKQGLFAACSALHAPPGSRSPGGDAVARARIAASQALSPAFNFGARTKTQQCRATRRLLTGPTIFSGATICRFRRYIRAGCNAKSAIPDTKHDVFPCMEVCSPYAAAATRTKVAMVLRM